MQIKRLEIKNCLGIKELELQAGKVNLIKGANEAGKTSLLESIEKALRNTDRRVTFVHDGAEEGTLYVELDDGLAIDRKVKADGKTSVKLSRGGEKIPRPEGFLRTITGEFSFNPVDFMGKKDKEQTEILLSLLPMSITEADLKEWFGAVPPVSLNQHAIHVLTYLAEKYFYDMRTIANSEVKECAAQGQALFEQLPDNYNGEEWREVNIGTLWQNVQEARRINSNREAAARILQGFQFDIEAVGNRFAVAVHKEQDACEERIGRYHGEIDAKKQRIAVEMDGIREQIRNLQEKLGSKERDLELIKQQEKLDKEALRQESEVRLTAILDEKKRELEKLEQRKKKAQTYLQEHAQAEVEPLESEARQAEEMKGYVPLFDNMKRLEEEMQDKKERAARLDRCVTLARQLPAELLAKTELPVQGLGINEEMQLTIDSLPIRNLSTGRQIKLALDIARATAGPLKLICIDRFESLDAINQELFFKEIENDGFQYFISTTELERDEEGRYIPELTVQTAGAMAGAKAALYAGAAGIPVGGGVHAGC